VSKDDDRYDDGNINDDDIGNGNNNLYHDWDADDIGDNDDEENDDCDDSDRRSEC
jgi:hypothetical protein